jgi:pimeloyl-ACP methyl ester carboxylesterase
MSAPTTDSTAQSAPTTSPSSARGARRALLGLAALASAVGGAAALAGCSSISKTELETRLLALEKNAPAAAVGLARLPMRADLGSGERDFELVHLTVPAEAAPADAATATEPRTPVVFVHGTPDTLFAWTPVIFGDASTTGVAGPRTVHAIEVIGHGIAPGPTGDVTFESCARYVAAAVRALGHERVHLVGNSYGAEFAWRAALNEPQLFASLTIVDGSGYARRPGDFLPEEVAMRENPLAKIGWLINAPDRIEVALAPHFDTIPADRTQEVYLVCKNRSNWHAMVDLVRDENGSRESELGSIRVPTLVLFGANDIAYEPAHYAQRFAADIPFARLVLVEGAGHYPHEQRTADFIAELERFWRDVEGL